MNQPLFEIEGSAPFTVYRTADGWTFAANTTGRTYESAEGAAAAAVTHAELALSIARSQVGIAAAADKASMYHACGPLTVVMPIGLRRAALLAGCRIIDSKAHGRAQATISEAVDALETWARDLEPNMFDISQIKNLREFAGELIQILTAVQS
jgi:hypothetical protein